MAERPDLRKIAGDIRVALETYPREALVDILTYVFQAYVVEGAPTLHAQQPERITELEGLSFADLMIALQTRLDVPELALFDVAGGRVSLRSGGESIPVSLSPADRRVSAAPLAPPAPPPAAPAEEPARAAAPAEAPRPRGISVGSTPGTAANPAGRPPAPAQRPAPAAPARPAAAPPQARPAQAPAQGGAQRQAADAPEGDDDAASRRFKLLEID
jgi:hypothetical protein